MSLSAFFVFSAFVLLFFVSKWLHFDIKLCSFRLLSPFPSGMQSHSLTQMHLVDMFNLASLDLPEVPIRLGTMFRRNCLV